MWRLSLPLLASSSFSNSRRHVRREAVFLPWNARPWPSYETHADQWRFLDRTLSAVVGMTPAEVSAKSLRLFPRRLLQDIEDPVLALQRRRRREAQHTSKPQQQRHQEQQPQKQAQQHQQRRRRDAAPLSTPTGARPSCFVQNNNDKAKNGGGVLVERGRNTVVPATVSSAATASSKNGLRSSRTQKRRDVTGTPLGMASGALASSSAAAAAPRAPTIMPTSTTSVNASNNIIETALVTRSPSSTRFSASAAVDNRMPGRPSRGDKYTTAAAGGKGEKRPNNKGNMKSQSGSTVLTSTVSIEAIKSGEAEAKHAAARETIDLKPDNSIAQPPLRKSKHSRSQGKGGKRGKVGNRSPASLENTAALTTSNSSTVERDHDGNGEECRKSPSGEAAGTNV
ncbi:hypothetical protein TraAM80_05143 [Trypanosoma rangeli]|uniref:Uncharacterized protein n=1 Tax=Trypanosoma rangeli TaxID=5698 RepID=A0A422NGE3_TRYRA|nr:uncharacterized protein TraAM80_05143 [Trypanosoma rangeli]RNF04545.1 hypothetical protein TraAM80_05143 [Trypanosoma rangeli]|eukprot:RNF04545.1 hypothetical protein TraAM80_05143 [Trypanosoma rangeli]